MSMQSSSVDGSAEDKESLPPMIVLNQRPKIKPQELPVTSILPKEKGQEERKPGALIWLSYQKPIHPQPRRPIYLTWWPEDLSFKLDRKPTLQRLSIQNRSSYSVQMHCCGLRLDDKAKLGAWWHYFPRTNFIVAPGLIHPLYIRAIPRNESPVKHACFVIQLATAYPRDHVLGFFAITVKVEFMNCNNEPENAAKQILPSPSSQLPNSPKISN